MIIPIQWRPKYIEGFEGLYGVVRAGFVYSFYSWIFLNAETTKTGYKRVRLYKKGEKPRLYSVHRLVALAFIPNPNNYPVINHKIDDFEHRSDNRVENLEWCTYKYNTLYSSHKWTGENHPLYGKQHTEETKKKISEKAIGRHHTEESKKKMSEHRKGADNGNAKKMRCIELNKVFDTIEDALKFINRSYTSLNRAIKRGGTCGGYHWKYEEDCK